MGGYAPYVWGAYLLTLTAMSGEVFLLIRRRKVLRDADRAATSLAGRAGQ
jgi:heme exporter protein CcmD